MLQQFYVPALKSKFGEFQALSKLDANTKKYVVPLLEITPPEFDQLTGKKPKTVEEHIQGFCKKLGKYWLYDHTLIDTALVGDQLVGGMTCIEYIFDYFALIHSPVPVVHMGDSQIQRNGIKSIVEKHGVNEIALRVTVEDIMSESFESDILSMLDDLLFAPEQCHIIFDLKDADFSQVDDFSDGLCDVILSFPARDSWRSFTLCGGAFPPTSQIKGPSMLIPRNDWQVYKQVRLKLQQQQIARSINYGDYGIVSPAYFEFDPIRMSRSANIRYTHDDTWLVMKGTKLKKSVDFDQYFGQAKVITKSQYYLGDTYSAGDTHLYQCAKGKTTHGNPTVWNWVGNNHHFTKVVSDLFANPAGI